MRLESMDLNDYLDLVEAELELKVEKIVIDD